MKYIKYIMSPIVLFFILSCEKDIAYNGEELTNFMVLNSILTADSLIECRITRSNTLLESGEIQSIDDAEVNLYKDGEFVETLKKNYFGDYFSEAGIRSEVGSNYAIKCSHNKYASIEASEAILTPVDAKILSMEEGLSSSNNYYYGGSGEVLKFRVQINDLKGNDFYRLRVYGPSVSYDYDYESEESSISMQQGNYTMYVNSKDPVLNGNKVVTENDFEDNPYNEYTVFDDILFDGESYVLQFEVDNPTIWFENEEEKKWYLDEIKVDVQHISEGLYKNFVTVTASNYYGDSPFSEPVQIYSNVEGGAGILGTVSSNILSE
ncbi:DUF4249 family protein [Saccharicrinis aurantiacus]|uniref:DUF4249 family protein n=1 Tax=Saccharicrinis aurantiacus TaxID=1849719 RepID=UPI00248FD671|nr:DUF4249 family protein [Saccharicrinis aurantiacus]